MWLIRLDGDTAVSLVSPKSDFSGELYSVQPSMAFGYHDLVLGSHMSAGETALTYFRFNGKYYASIASAVNSCDKDGKCEISAAPAPK